MIYNLGQKLTINGRTAEVYYIEDRPNSTEIRVEYEDDQSIETITVNTNPRCI